MTMSMTIEASANRGRTYRVEYADDGAVIAVDSRVSRGSLWSPVHSWRSLWRADSGKPMSITAACAVHAANAKRNPSALDKLLAGMEPGR